MCVRSPVLTPHSSTGGKSVHRGGALTLRAFPSLYSRFYDLLAFLLPWAHQATGRLRFAAIATKTRRGPALD